MGAVNVIEYKWAKSVSEAFQEVSEDARDEHGSDYYSGEINNTSLEGTVPHINELRFNTKKWHDAIDDFLENNCEKGDCYYYEVSKQSAKNHKYYGGLRMKQRGTKMYYFFGVAPY